MVASSESDLGSDDDDVKMEEAEDALEDEEDRKEAKVKELDEILAADPTNYQAHLDRVSALRALGELERLRSAREDFAKVYPLSPELWLEWLEDEKSLANKEEEKEKVRTTVDTGQQAQIEVYNSTLTNQKFCSRSSVCSVVQLRTMFPLRFGWSIASSP